MELDLHATKKRYSRASVLLSSWSSPPKLKVRRRRGEKYGKRVTLTPSPQLTMDSEQRHAPARSGAKNEFGAF